MQEDFLNLRLLIEVLHKSRRGSAVLDSLLGQIHTGEGNKVVFPPIPARHLFKRRIGKQVNGALKKVYRAAVAVCDPKRIVLVTAGAVTQNTAVIGRSVGRIARSIFLIKAHAHKIVIRQALENQPLVNAALDDGIVDAPAEKILCNFICGSTFIRQKQDLRLRFLLGLDRHRRHHRRLSHQCFDRFYKRTALDFHKIVKGIVAADAL